MSSATSNTQRVALILHNDNMQRKQRMNSGVFLEALSIDIMFKYDKNCTCRKKVHFLIPLKYTDVVRRTNATLHVLQCRNTNLMILGTLMVTGDSQGHGAVSLSARQ